MQNITLKNANVGVEGRPHISFSVEGITNKDELEDAIWQIREFATKAFEDHRLKMAGISQEITTVKDNAENLRADGWPVGTTRQEMQRVLDMRAKVWNPVKGPMPTTYRY